MHLGCDTPEDADIGQVWKAPCCGEWWRLDRSPDAAYGVPPRWVRIGGPL